MSHYDQLWVEKYRPKNLSEIVLSKEIKEELEKIENDIPHMLFYGKAGIGKTSIAKIIINSILGCQYLYINASDENGIDTIRNKVISFAQTRSIDGTKKVILLDEMDAMTGSAMRSLRNVMEEYAETCRFILTCNYYAKIIEPIRSRCVIFNPKPDLKGCIQRCMEILKKENIELGNNLQSLAIFVKERFPAMRRTINDLQKSCITGKLILVKKDLASGFISELWNRLKNKENTIKLREFIITGEVEFDSDYQQLFSSLFDAVYNDKDIKELEKKQILLELGEATYRDNFVVDHEINFYCFLLNVEKILY